MRCPSHLLRVPQAEESEEEEEEKTEASYDYLSPFLPPLIGMQQLTREQAFEVRSILNECVDRSRSAGQKPSQQGNLACPTAANYLAQALGATARHSCSARLLGTAAWHGCLARLLSTAAWHSCLAQLRRARVVSAGTGKVFWGMCATCCDASACTLRAQTHSVTGRIG